MNNVKISVCLLSLMWAVGAQGRDEYRRTFDRTVPWGQGKRVFVEHKLGDVTVHTHAGPEVVIHAEIKVSAGDAGQAKEFADRIEIAVEPSSSELSIRTRYPSEPGSGMWQKNVSYTVRYDLTVPEATPLEIHNAFGGVAVSGVKASSQVTTSHGDVEWRDGAGSQHLVTAFSNVRVANNVGDVAVETSNGGVAANDVRGKLTVADRFGNIAAQRIANGLSIVNTNGSVEVGDAGGAGEIRNSFGSVTVHGISGDLSVNNTNGRVEALNVKGGAELNTTFGEVRFADVGRTLSIRANNSGVSGERVGGSLQVETSFGSVKVSDIAGAVEIESKNGAVALAKIRGAANVKTSFGTVDARDVAGALTVENANGAVTGNNLGGAEVKTSYASVVLGGVSGPIEVADQNGAVDVDRSGHGGGCQPVSIHTSFATLRVRLPSGANYHVAARTSFGDIRTDFPLTVSVTTSHDSLDGTIGNGHCEMSLTNKNGAIEIVKGGA